MDTHRAYQAPINTAGSAHSAAQRDVAHRSDRERRDNNVRHALQIWRNAQPAGIIAETYFASRSITVALPLTIRETPAPRHGPTRSDPPAIVCAVHGLDGKVIWLLAS